MPARDWTVDQQDQLIAEAVERDRPRLRSFIRKHVLDMSDAEDVLQDVFYELTATYRMMKPVEQVTAWLYRVARNRIADLFRRQKAVSLSEPLEAGEDSPALEDLLPSPDAGPDALYARNLMLEALDEALDELPENQREVFGQELQAIGGRNGRERQHAALAQAVRRAAPAQAAAADEGKSWYEVRRKP
jgi:RNA polymerase sigma factor (sigma-70 family)